MSLTTEQQAIELIGRAKHILLLAPEHASTDTITSIVACGLLLQKLNKTFDVTVPGWSEKNRPAFLSKQIEIRPDVGAVQTFHVAVNVRETPLSELMYDVKDGVLNVTLVPKKGAWTAQDFSFKSGEQRYDLIIAVGCPDLNSLGEIARTQADFLYRTTIINLDCHSTNEHWGQVNLVDLNAVSVSETLYHWINTWNAQLIDEPMATALLAGMIAETHGFRTGNVTPKTLSASSALLTLGGKRDEIVRQLWRTRPLTTLKIWGRALSRLEMDRELGLVWTTLLESDFLESGSTQEALTGVVDELLAYAPEAKVIVLLSQQKGELLVSLHTTHATSAAEIARAFGGQGTRERATFNLTGSDAAAGTKTIIERIKVLLKKP